MPSNMSLSDLTDLVGWGLELPLAALTYVTSSVGTAVRKSRLLHPDGRTYKAIVEPLSGTGEVGELAAELRGRALVLLSAAIWRHDREWADALECAIRFGWAPSDGTRARRQHQDILFATVRSAWTLPLAPFSTNVHNYMANDYYAVSAFETRLHRSYARGAALAHHPRAARLKFRLVPLQHKTQGRDRFEKLERMIEESRAEFRLEVSIEHLDHEEVEGAKCETSSERDFEHEECWDGLACIKLVERVSLDQEALQFSPFLNGKGIRPIGLLSTLHNLSTKTKGQALSRPALNR